MGPIQSHNPDIIRQIESLVERFVKVDSSPAVEVVAVDSSPAAGVVGSSPAAEVVAVDSSPVVEVVAVDSSPVVEVVAVDSSPAVEGFLRLLVGSAERVVFGLGRLDGEGIEFFQQQGKK